MNIPVCPARLAGDLVSSGFVRRIAYTLDV